MSDRQVTVILEEKDDGKYQVKIISEGNNGNGDPWDDISALLEGIGILTTICMNNGKIEHNGQPINDYLKSYINKVCEDYKCSVAILPGGYK